jgi:hypothetical protein
MALDWLVKSFSGTLSPTSKVVWVGKPPSCQL